MVPDPGTLLKSAMHFCLPIEVEERSALCGKGLAHMLALKRLDVRKHFIMECRSLSKLV